MSKIKFKVVSDNAITVTLSPDVPAEMTQQLSKSLLSKGFTEDLSKSTLSKRFFYKQVEHRVHSIADQLIKSLEMLKTDESPTERRRREMAESQGIKYEPNKLVPNIQQSVTGHRSTSSKPNKLGIPVMSTLDNDDKSEDDVEKSGYGPKGGGQYDVKDNVKRKMKNVGDVAGQGPNVNVKSYSTKPGQRSAKAQAADLATKQAKLNREQPVKVFSQEEKDEMARKMALKKGWGNHLPFPSAIQQPRQVESGEEVFANQLASMMQSKAMFDRHRQPTSEDMVMAGEAMGLGVSNEIAKGDQNQWNNTISNWLQEASKPISQRFSSEEEELAYWNSIKLNDSGNDSGY